MVIHLTTSDLDIRDNIGQLRKIIGCIKAEGHDMARNWIETAYKSGARSGSVSSKAWQQHIEDISKADAVIIEATRGNFELGFQLATALQQKKPTLVLTRAGSTHNSFVKSLAGNPSVSHKEYDFDNLEDIVRQFISDNDIQARDLRFNFFIDRPIYNYLRWAAFKTGKTKAEILRELVQKEIEKDES